MEVFWLFIQVAIRIFITSQFSFFSLYMLSGNFRRSQAPIKICMYPCYYGNCHSHLNSQHLALLLDFILYYTRNDLNNNDDTACLGLHVSYFPKYEIIPVLFEYMRKPNQTPVFIVCCMAPLLTLITESVRVTADNKGYNQIKKI